MDEVIEPAVVSLAVTGNPRRQRQPIQGGATNALIQQLGVGVEHRLFKRQVLQGDCPLIGIVERSDVLDEQVVIDDLEVQALVELRPMQEVVAA